MPSSAARRSLRALAKGAGFRVKLKPRRDALTRVRHDLRSLLQSVVGYSDLLAEPRYGTLTAEQQRFVGHVREAAQHLQELVDTCIELSRPDHDGPRLDPPLVQVGQVLRRVRNTLLARARCCDLTVAPELETRCLALDANQVERALCLLVEVLTREGQVTLHQRATVAHESLLLVMHASDAADPSVALTSSDALEDQLGNRDFVRLKLAEVLLERLGFELRVSPGLDVAELVCRL